MTTKDSDSVDKLDEIITYLMFPADRVRDPYKAKAELTKYIANETRKARIEMSAYIDELIDGGYRTDTDVGQIYFKKLVHEKAQQQLNKGDNHD